jgi:hypothetical protein
MPRFNVKSSQESKTINLADGEAFQESPKLEFISILLTSFIKDKYYRCADDTIKRLIELTESIPDKKFIAKTAIYARNEFGMRSVSHLVAGEVARLVKGQQWTKRFFDKVIHRVDDITETLAYYLDRYRKPIPNAMKKGLARAFDKFDAYQLAKYRGEGAAVSLVDAMNLVHPIPTEKNEAALRMLVAGTLKSEGTWEARLTKAGQEAQVQDKKLDKKKTWEEIIDMWIITLPEEDRELETEFKSA